MKEVGGRQEDGGNIWTSAERLRIIGELEKEELGDGGKKGMEDRGGREWGSGWRRSGRWRWLERSKVKEEGRKLRIKEIG